MKLTFTKTPDPENKYDQSTVTYSVDDAVFLPDVLEDIGNFLKACGFSINSEIIVKDTEDTEDSSNE